MPRSACLNRMAQMVSVVTVLGMQTLLRVNWTLKGKQFKLEERQESYREETAYTKACKKEKEYQTSKILRDLTYTAKTRDPNKSFLLDDHTSDFQITRKFFQVNIAESNERTCENTLSPAKYVLTEDSASIHFMYSGSMYNFVLQ